MRTTDWPKNESWSLLSGQGTRLYLGRPCRDNYSAGKLFTPRGIFGRRGIQYIVRRTMAYRLPRGSIIALAVGLATAWLMPGAARAQNEPKLFQLELGATIGGHFFANDVELGVADDPALPHPKSSVLMGLRAGVLVH